MDKAVLIDTLNEIEEIFLELLSARENDFVRIDIIIATIGYIRVRAELSLVQH